MHPFLCKLYYSEHYLLLHHIQHTTAFKLIDNKRKQDDCRPIKCLYSNDKESQEESQTPGTLLWRKR